jgi:hypothetical protein
MFSGLDPETTYYVKISDGTNTSIAAYTTAADDNVQFEGAGAAAEVGKIVMKEDFGQFQWGGESVEYFPGYSLVERGKDTTKTIFHPSGTIALTYTSAGAVATPSTGFFWATPNTHMGLYNTLKSYSSTRIRYGAWYAEEDKTGTVCVESGCLKIGASKYTADFVLPQITKTVLNGSTTLKLQLDFDVAPYCEGNVGKFDNLAGGKVEVLNGKITSPRKLAQANTTVKSTTPFTFNTTTAGWQHVTVTLEGVVYADRIAIGPVRGEGSVAGTDQCRMYIDNIQVKVLAME